MRYMKLIKRTRLNVKELGNWNKNESFVQQNLRWTAQAWRAGRQK
jgi:hypothetical protein